MLCTMGMASTDHSVPENTCSSSALVLYMRCPIYITVCMIRIFLTHNIFATPNVLLNLVCY